MKTSVVIATYNGEKFLNQQMESILSQTVLPDEIVVVDDGSTDATKEIMKEYAEQYNHTISFKLVFREENLGYIKNFIDGIGQTSNELVFLCDQDDLWDINKIEKMVSYFEEQQDMIVLHTNTTIINQNNQTLKENAQDYIHSLDKVSLQKFVKKVNYPGMSMAFRKDSVYPSLKNLVDNITLPTHDWVIALIGVLSNGFYVSSDTYTYRRDTGENVALQIETTRLSSTERRITGVELYDQYYTFLVNAQNFLEGYSPEIFVKYSENAHKRIDYLRKNKLSLVIKNIVNVNYYPSKKAYLGDLILILRGRRDV